MIETITLGEAADRLGLSPEQIDALGTLGVLVHLDLHAGFVLPKALAKFTEGFLDSFDREVLGLRARTFPRWLPASLARKYLRVSKGELKELIDQGEVETGVLEELSDDDVLGVLRGLEVVAGLGLWEDEIECLLQSIAAKRGVLDTTTASRNRKIARAHVGNQVLGTDSVRKLRRRSARRPSSPEAEE